MMERGISPPGVHGCRTGVVEIGHVENPECKLPGFVRLTTRP
jgi:hypothetical protein